MYSLMKSRLVSLVVLLVYSHCQVHGKSNRFDSELIDYLMKDYGKPYVRPDSDPVHVGFRFSPTISILDETNEELRLRGMLAMTWYDDRLTWDPEQQENVETTYIPLFDDNKPFIWKPELVLNESLDKDSNTFHTETEYVQLFSNGTIYWYTLAMTTSYCRVDVQHFPLDRQICVLTFTTWLYKATEQTFDIIDDLTKNENYKKYEVRNGLWDFKILKINVGNASYDCSTCDDQEQSFIEYTLELTRRSRVWYIVNYLLPCIVMSGMTILIFWLPQKLDVDAPTFGLTCILTLFVFLTFLFTQLPATGPPLMGLYIVWLIIEAVLATVYVTVMNPKSLKPTNFDGRIQHDNEGEEEPFINTSQHNEWVLRIPWLLIIIKFSSFLVLCCVLLSWH